MHTGVAPTNSKFIFGRCQSLNMSPWVATRLALWCFMIMIFMTVMNDFCVMGFVPQEVTIEGESTLIPSLEGDLEVRFAINKRMHTTVQLHTTACSDEVPRLAKKCNLVSESVWILCILCDFESSMCSTRQIFWMHFRQVLCQHKFVVWSLSAVKPKTWKRARFELERHQYHSSLVVSNDEMTRY